MTTISKNVKIPNTVLFQAIWNVYNTTTINACHILLEMVSSDDYIVMQDSGGSVHRVITIFSVIHVMKMLPHTWGPPT